MAERPTGVQPVAQSAVLGVGAQIARDARLRLLCALGVVFVHAAYPPANPVLLGMDPLSRAAAFTAYTVTVTFPVHAFILLSFLNLVPRMDAGGSPRVYLRATFMRLLPAHVFWVVVYLGLGALFRGAPPAVPEIVSGLLIGDAAAHLYFTPLLLTLSALAPVLGWLARRPLRAASSVLLCAVSSAWLWHQLPDAPRFVTALIGVVGMAPIAIAGIFLGRAWSGLAPGPGIDRVIALGAGAVAALAAITLGSAAWLADGQPLTPTAPIWLSRFSLGLAVPVLLLSVSGRIPMWLLKLAPCTLGVYFVHPLFIKALQLVEARLLGPQSGWEGILIGVNLVVATALSVLAVKLLVRTPLKWAVL